MIVSLNKSQLDWFRRKARDNPNEILAFLIGRRISPYKVRVEQIVYPKLAVSTPLEVTAVDGETHAIGEKYSNLGTLIGDIHTHPDAPPTMSHGDFHDHKRNGYIVSGIVSVNQRKTHVSFWQLDSALPCGWEYHTM